MRISDYADKIWCCHFCDFWAEFRYGMEKHLKKEHRSMIKK